MKLKMMFIIAASALLAAPSTGCSSSDGATSSSEIDADQAKAKALAAVPGGTASAAEKLDEATEHRWKVEVKLASGATLIVEIERASGVVAEIAGEKGPFDYDLPAPAPGLMTFTQAKEKAFAQKKGTIELWEVKPPENQYELYVRDADTKLWEIKLTADKGELKSVEQKDKPD